MASIIRILGAVLFAGIAFLVFAFAFPEQEIRHSLPGGFPLTPFDLPVLNDGLLEGDTTHFGSENLEGKVVLMTFWATWCTPCIAEQPVLLDLQEEFAASGFRVVAVLHRDDPATANRWLDVNDRQDLFSLVGTADFAKAIRVGGLPHSLLVNRDGEVLEIFGGWSPDREPYLRRRVRELVSS